MRSKGDSHLLPGLNQECLCFMDLFKCAEDKEKEAKRYTQEEKGVEDVRDRDIRRGTKLHGLPAHLLR